MREQLLEYRDGETVCEGFLCYDESQPSPRPTVLINHTIVGRNDLIDRRARRLAWSGYACLALDNYGKGRRGGTPEQNQALIAPFMNDRAMLRRRLLAGLAAAQALPIVDSKRIAVMGYCFGGLCALDFARANADVRGVVSIHGLLKSAGITEPKINARVLMLHGHDDPLAPPEDVHAVAREFTAAGADWQIHVYGHTVHAFTNPTANDRAAGLQYDEAADRRSWHALEEFLAEVLK